MVLNYFGYYSDYTAPCVVTTITEIDQSADGILYVRQCCSTRANMLAFTTFCLTNARRFR